MAVKPIPDGYHTVTPYLMVEGAERLLKFLEQAFGAKLVERMDRPDGAIGHAEVRLGDSIVMLGEASGPRKATPTVSALYLYVPDADTAYRRALEAGATSEMAPADQFYGDRNGMVKDFAGNLWSVATHIEDVTPEEIRRRAAEQMKKQ